MMERVLRVSIVILALAFLAAGCGGDGGHDTGRDVPPEVPADLPGEIAGDLPTEISDLPAEIADLPGEASDLPAEVGDATPDAPCAEGESACDGTFTALCGAGGVLQRVADCAADGWMCQGGRCVATAAETEAEAAWRELLDALRTDNARAPLEADERGGWKNAPAPVAAGTATGFYRVEKRDGTWWLVTPDGAPMISKGVTDVNFLGPNLQMDDLQAALAAKHGSEEAWAEDAEARLRGWGFNTVGPWSGRSILSRVVDAEPILDIVHRVPRPDGLVMDVFVPEYREIVMQLATERCVPRKDDPNLLGWFLDNELAWDNCWQTPKRLLRLYFEFPAGQPGREVALAFLREAAGDSLETFNAGWKTGLASWDDLATMPSGTLEPATPEAGAWAEAFAVNVFDRYAGEAVKAIREADPNHLILGCRFSTWHFDALMAAAGRHFDVISLAYYSETPPVEDLDRAGPAIDRPFLLEEWSFKGTDSGLMNILAFAPVVPTQQDRGLAYARYVKSLIRRPWVVAYHWYKWFDNPPREDNILSGDNFGLMNQDDEPYLPLVRMAGEVNRRVEAWHREGVP
jgi:agarase